MDHDIIDSWDNTYLEYIERMAKIEELRHDNHLLLYEYNKNHYLKFVSLKENNIIL